MSSFPGWNAPTRTPRCLTCQGFLIVLPHGDEVPQAGVELLHDGLRESREHVSDHEDDVPGRRPLPGARPGLRSPTPLWPWMSLGKPPFRIWAVGPRLELLCWALQPRQRAGARGGAGRTAALSCVATEAPGPSGRAESPEEGPPAHREADAQPCPRPLRPHVTRR